MVNNGNANNGDGDSSGPTKIRYDQLLIAHDELKDSNAALQVKYDALLKIHTEIVSDLEAENRAGMMKELKKLTTLEAEDIMALSTPDMSRLLQSYRYLKKPIAGIRSGDKEPKADSRYTVPNRFKYGPK